MQMLCEECSHFLEIAEAIRSLGLTILKGITEVQGEKTWICFVVEVYLNLLDELSVTRGTMISFSTSELYIKAMSSNNYRSEPSLSNRLQCCLFFCFLISFAF
jgi:hypothetical protein